MQDRKQQFEALMSQYGEHHQNDTNIKMHCLAIPLIYFSALALLWCLLSLLPIALNLVWVIALMVCIYYLRLSVKHGLLMSVLTVLMLLAIEWLSTTPVSVLWSSITVFVSMWILQFWGHKIEGKKPSFFEDLRFLLIGPLWWSDHFVKRS